MAEEGKKLKLTPLGEFVAKHTVCVPRKVWRDVILAAKEINEQGGDWPVLFDELKHGAEEMLKNEKFLEIVYNDKDDDDIEHSQRRLLTAYEERKEKASKDKKVRNEALPAGSPMYFYCGCCEVLVAELPESYTVPPPRRCEDCQRLVDQALIDSSGKIIIKGWISGQKEVP